MTAGSSGFASPVTYCTLPAGAAQVLPFGNTPPPALASGDTTAV